MGSQTGVLEEKAASHAARWGLMARFMCVHKLCNIFPFIQTCQRVDSEFGLALIKCIFISVHFDYCKKRIQLVLKLLVPGVGDTVFSSYW